MCPGAPLLSKQPHTTLHCKAAACRNARAAVDAAYPAWWRLGPAPGLVEGGGGWSHNTAMAGSVSQAEGGEERAASAALA